MDKKAQFSLWYFLFIFLIMYMIQSLFFPGAQFQRIPYNEFRKLAREGKVERVDILGDRLRGRFKAAGAEGAGRFFETAKVEDPGLIKTLEDAGVTFQGQYEPPWVVTFFSTWVLPLAILFSIYAFVLRKMGPGQGVMAFGRNKAKIYAEREVGVRFTDVDRKSVV